MYKSGEVGPSTTADGKEFPLEEDKEYLALKKRTPKDYREIKAVRRAQKLPKEVADGIKTLWEVMLVEVRHSDKDDGLGIDGTTYHFSGRVENRGDLSGHIWTPDPESKSGQLARLAEALADFARGTAPLKTLELRLEAAKKSIAPPAP
jgi:hypothetical protein